MVFFHFLWTANLHNKKGFFSVQPVDASCNVKYLVLLHVYDP